MLSTRRLYLPLVAAGAISLAAGCAGSEPSTADAVQTTSTTRDDLTEDLPSRFFESDLPEHEVEASWFTYNSIGDLLARADAVVVAQIVGVERDVLVEGPDSDDLAATTTRYDGIVFQTSMVIAGDSAVSGSTIVVAHPAVMTIPGRGDFRLELEPANLLRDGLEGSDAGLPIERRAMYLLFLVEGPKPDLMYFVGPQGVVEVYEDGLLGIGHESGPFGPIIEDVNPVNRGLRLDDVTSWVRNGAPPILIPDEAKPDPKDDPSPGVDPNLERDSQVTQPDQ